jgi:hypothetical protein
VEFLQRQRLAGGVMAHRGMPERGPGWKLGRDLLLVAAVAVVCSGAYILLSLALHGTVSW